MNDPGLRAVLARITSEVAASPDVADTAWSSARRQSRRATIAAVGTAGAAAALAVALIGGPLTHDRATPPITTPATPTVETAPATVHSSIPAHLPRGPVADYSERLRAVTQSPWNNDAIDSLPRLDNALPSTLVPFAPSVRTTLGDDPIDRALAVAQRRGTQTLDIRVLGADGRWRIIDTEGLQPSFSDGAVVSLIGGSPISPDGTRLALPQPHSVVVVSLRTATSREIAVPGDRAPSWMPRSAQWSPDGTELLVGSSSGTAGSTLVHVVDGSNEQLPYNAFVSGFAPDGSVVVIRDGGCGFCELVRFDGTPDGTIPVSDVLLGAELYVPRPAVGTDAIAVARAVRSWAGPRSAPINSDGLLVVSPDDGAPLGFLPMRAPHQAENSELVGWLDSHTLVVRLFVPAVPWARDALVAWNYQTGELWSMTDPWSWTDDFEVAFAVHQLEGLPG